MRYSDKVASLSIVMIILLSPPDLHAQDLPETYPSHYFAFTPVDSTTYPDIYQDQQVRDSITSNFKNAYKAAQAIEDYALNKQKLNFLKRSDEQSEKWLLTLTSGKEIEISPSPGSNAVDYTFEHYYSAAEIIVFRAQWYEGNDYVLVSRKNGNKTHTYGPPLFSPSKMYFLAYNGVEVSDYSNNGLQLFQLTNEGIKKLIEYDTDLVPSQCKWINDRIFHLQIYEATLRSGRGIERNYQHYRIEIEQTSAGNSKQ